MPRGCGIINDIRRNAKLTSHEEQTIYSLRLAGLTMRAIANEVGVSQATVSRTLSALGDPRPHAWPKAKTCIVEGCEQVSQYRPGYCGMHHMREVRGIPLDAPLIRAPKGQRRSCIVEGCGRPRGAAGGYCGTHGRQLRREALRAAIEPRMKQPKTCTFDGCVGKAVSKGYCSAHLAQMRTHGRMAPLTKRTVWDECTYTGAHHRCRQLWGKVQQYPCVGCGKAAEEWAYDGKDQSELYDEREWVLRSILPYSRFPEFYMPMCKSCHKKRDMEEIRAELDEFRVWRKLKRQGFADMDDPPF
ncbi:MAG: helix-turn-helix domain-containing protein [Actinomycetota bacterium]|nr:helix-turn-helix domain-containing protein [Actinomycetota bacterium]